MYPVLFRIGSFEITSFGVLVAVAALVGIWLFGTAPKRIEHLPRPTCPDEGANLIDRGCSECSSCEDVEAKRPRHRP